MASSLSSVQLIQQTACLRPLSQDGLPIVALIARGPAGLAPDYPVNPPDPTCLVPDYLANRWSGRSWPRPGLSWKFACSSLHSPRLPLRTGLFWQILALRRLVGLAGVCLPRVTLSIGRSTTS